MGVCDNSVSVFIIHINRVPVEGNISLYGIHYQKSVYMLVVLICSRI